MIYMNEWMNFLNEWMKHICVYCLYIYIYLFFFCSTLYIFTVNFNQLYVSQLTWNKTETETKYKY